jgi:PAS domain S-box-containing protein
VEGVYISCNSMFERFFGAGEADIVGKTDYDFVERDLADNFRENDRKTMDAGKPTSNEECVTYKDDGHRVFLETIKTPMYDAQGALIGVLGIGRDITERKRAEESLRQANSKLNILSSITRHDIKNQLTTLTGHLAMLDKNDAQPSFEGHLHKAGAAAKRISTMIQFTKEYEDIGVHIPSGQDVRTLIENCIKEAHLGHIRIVNDVPPMTEIFADPLIVKVFHNLIDNAMRHGGKTTTIHWFVEDVEGVPAIVCEDDGVGIPEDMKESIFTCRSGKDHGFGLFLSREILAINDVSIIEAGKPGKGAKFIISLPPCEPGDQASGRTGN